MAVKVFEWVELGSDAYALADGERIAGVLYWSPAGVAEKDGPGGEPGVLDAAFFWVDAESVSHHEHVLDSTAENRNDRWDRACELVGAYVTADDTARELLAELVEMPDEDRRVAMDELSPEHRALADIVFKDEVER